jgi:hypothetical protein
MPHYPIGLRQYNLLMVVSVVTAIDNILMGHIGLTARQFKELSKMLCVPITVNW